jgi:hypothetical protein
VRKIVSLEFKNIYMYTQTHISPSETASSKVFSTSKLNTSQSERIFQRLLSIYEKHDSPSVDEAVMFSLTSIIADIIDRVVELDNEESDDNQKIGPIKDVIEYEIQRYRDTIEFQILKHVQSDPEVIKSEFKCDFKSARSFAELDFPSYLAVCPTSIAEVFNWRRFGAVDTLNCLSLNESKEKREAIYDSVLQDLDFLDYNSADESETDEVFEVENIIEAFTRYQIHRHASSHCLYYNHLETLAKFFSDLYAVNLQSRFTKCSCCDAISRDRSESHSM